MGMSESSLADVGLLIVRLVIGLTFIGHGTQKLFGWFGGAGISGTGQWLESLGFRPGGRIWAILAGALELLAGAMLCVGVLLPVAAVFVIVVMLDAIITVHWRNGYWADRGGFEYNVVLIATVIALACVGPGNDVLFILP